MRVLGVDAEPLSPRRGQENSRPLIDLDGRTLFPVYWADFLQRRGGGTVRHDAVAWGYARAAGPAPGWTSSSIAR